MKESEYNLTAIKNDRTILFNSLTGSVLSFAKSEYETITTLIKDVDIMKEKYPTLFNYFIEKGFVVEDETNELDIIRFRNNNGIFLDREYRLVLNPTLECNFNCWYCYEKHDKGRMSKYTMQKIRNHVNFLINKRQIDSLHLDWFGGEPLLYFEEIVYPMTKYFKERLKKKQVGFRSGITTNGYLVTPEMINHFKEIDLSFFQITIDGNKERHDKVRRHYNTPSYDVIINNINLLCREMENISIVLRVNYDERTMENDFTKDLEVILKENRHKITIDFQRVWQTIDKKLISNQWKIKLSSKVREMGFLYKGLGQFYPYKENTCYVDRFNHLEINYDGKIYKCTAKGYDDEYVVGNLKSNGELIWNKNELCNRFSLATFENDMCLKCKCLPICMGPCSQKILDTKNCSNLDSICTFKLSEFTIEDYIVDYYETLIDYKNNLCGE